MASYKLRLDSRHLRLNHRDLAEIHVFDAAHDKHVPILSNCI